MTDPAVLLGAIFALYLVFSKIMEFRRERLAQARPKKPVCGCTHHLSHHNPKTGHCEIRVREEVHWIRNPELVRALEKGDDYIDDDIPESVPDEWALVRCTCQRYVGPEPLGAELFAPDIATEYVEQAVPAREIEPERNPEKIPEG